MDAANVSWSMHQPLLTHTQTWLMGWTGASCCWSVSALLICDWILSVSTALPYGCRSRMITVSFGCDPRTSPVRAGFVDCSVCHDWLLGYSSTWMGDHIGKRSGPPWRYEHRLCSSESFERNSKSQTYLVDYVTLSTVGFRRFLPVPIMGFHSNAEAVASVNEHVARLREWANPVDSPMRTVLLWTFVYPTTPTDVFEWRKSAPVEPSFYRLYSWLIPMKRVSARQQTRRSAHLEHLALEAIEAIYGNPAKVACLRFSASNVLPSVVPMTRWRGRKLSDWFRADLR